jgi:FkbM family methyltransferase
MENLKQDFRSKLKRTAIYQRLKTSPVQDLYWAIVDQSHIVNKTLQVNFYRDLLVGYRPGDLIFDIGANVGEKTGVFLKLGARVVAVEPDEFNQNILKQKFLRLRLAPKPIVIVGNAVSDSARVETMYVDGPGSALNTLNHKWVETLQHDKKRFENTSDKLDFAQKKQIETITLEQLIVTHGIPFFVKIDVEGYEVQALRGLKQSVPFLSFEVNLPEFMSEGLECVRLLNNLAVDGKFNYAADFRHGLKLGEWVTARSFSVALEQCTEKNIEVFWTTLRPTHKTRAAPRCS